MVTETEKQTLDAAPIRVITRGDVLRMAVLEARRNGKSIGLVPTMGALHEGHLSLVDASCRENDLTIVSIFVNPIQFNDAGDLERYPRNLDADLAALRSRNCNIVFTPSVEELYPPGHETYVEVGPTALPLEGEQRPGHFRGVATVVLKLFHLAPADRAYFGQKDYQQVLVIRCMVRDLNVPIEIRVCPTIRELDGLAMSSRNVHLDADEHQWALALAQSLELAAELVERGVRDKDTIIQRMRQHIHAAGRIDIDYIALVADETVTPVKKVDGPIMVLLAAHVGKTRLIDNRRIEW
ncbi:MAG: pantoate--beta-alanine ligase [Pirellulales bacterium]|nr:pantoate--beta-alanine ligase [Pirellulales bacterium]